MDKISYENRYNDVFTFTKLENGDVLWEGNFKHCRFGWPNVYDGAYEAYCADVDTDDRMTLGEFKNAVHEYDNEKSEYTPLAKQYGKLVYSDTKKISMVDPSGGPYITTGQMLSHIIGGDEMNVIVESFEPVETGYLIKTKPHEYDPNDMSYLQDRDIIGGII
jgi:hypothetical protein